MAEGSSKIILITGVNSPLGHAMREWALHRGYYIIGTHRQPDLKPEDCSRNIALFLVDYFEKDSIKNFVESVERSYDRVDCLINNVSSWHHGGILSQNVEDVREQLDTSIGGTVEITRRVLKLLLKSEDAQIINICSTAGTNYRWTPNTTYVTLKAAISAFGQSLRRELYGKNVKVTNIHLGKFESGEQDEKELMKISDVVKAIGLIFEVSEATVIDEIVMTPVKYEY